MSLPQSNIDWARYMEGLQGKVNTTADNLTAIGKDNIAGLSMPSDKFTNIVVGASGQEYIAPANGEFTVFAGGGTNKYLKLYRKDTGCGFEMGFSSPNNLMQTLTVHKNNIVKIEYSGVTSVGCIFTYTEGSKGE